MAWEEVDLQKLSDKLGIDINEIDQKLKLRDMIIKVRKKNGLTQEELAQLVGVSRSRIAQIESGVKLYKTTFDVFLRILQGLGYKYDIRTSKLAA